MTDRTQAPDGWLVARLGDVAEVIGGSTPPRDQEKYWGGDVPWVVPSELAELSGRYLRTSRETITDEGVKAAGLRVIPPGSVLLTSRATIGATAINTIPVTTNQGFQCLVSNNSLSHQMKPTSIWLLYYQSVSAMRTLKPTSASEERSW